MSTAGPETVVAVGAGKGDTGGTEAESGTVSITASTSSKNLLQQLPAGAVLAFQALASTFTNQGNCYTSNWWLTLGLVTVLSATCIFFSFTDSIFHNGKVYYGVALPGRLNIINMHKREEKRVFQDLKPKMLRKLGLKAVDWVHAFLSLVVFLTIAGSDVGLLNCFFPKANDDTRQLLKTSDWIHAFFSAQGPQEEQGMPMM
jgi:hypothetical protein